MAEKIRRDPRIVGLEKALESVPIEQRAALTAEIEAVFHDFDPENPPGEDIPALPPGTRSCPKCGGTLTVFAAIEGDGAGRPGLLILDCEACGTSYSTEVVGGTQ